MSRFEEYLPDIFDSLNKTWSNIDGKMKSESFKQKVINIIRAWEERALFASDFLMNLQNRFLGLFIDKTAALKVVNRLENKNDLDDADNDVDGKPLDEDEESQDHLDGKPRRTFL